MLLMTHNYYYRLGFLLLMLSCAHSLSAQWSKLPSPGNESVYNVYSVGNDWVAYAESGCYYSGNNGLNWSLTLPINASYSGFVKAFGTEVYAIAKDVGLYRSSDHGQSWTLLTNQTQGGFAYPDGLAVTDNYILYETDNAVYRYDKANPGAFTTVFDAAPVYYPNSLQMTAQGNDLWIAAQDSLLHSSDEGSTWSLVHEGIRAQGMCIRGDTLMLSTETGVMRSVNNGLDWNQVLTAGSAYQIFLLGNQWFVSTYTNSGSSTMSSVDGGNTWTAFSPLLDKAYLSIVARNGNTLFAVGTYGVARSTDGGNYWELQNTGMAFDDVFFFDGNIAKVGNYLSMYNYYSEDNGQSWFQPIIDARSIEHPIAAYNGNYFAVDYDRKLYRSIGDLRHWEYLGVQFATGLSQVFWEAGGHFYRFEYDGWNGGPVVMYESFDEGLTWTPTTGVVSNNVGLVAQGSHLFELRSFNGLFRSDNGGVTWQSVGAGLGELLQWGNDAKLYSDGINLFAYSSNAIFVSKNNGLTFLKISNNLPGNFGFPTGADYLVSDGNMVIAFTYGDIFLSQGLQDQWYSINGNLPLADFYHAKLLLHNGNILLDGGGDAGLWQRSIASIALAQFSGKLWHDDNNNGQQDAGELPYQGAIVQAGTGSFATSNATGDYTLPAVLDNDTLRVKKPAPWVQANPDFYLVSSAETGKDFGLYFPPNITDLRIDMTNESVFRPGFAENIYLSYGNAGTTDADADIRFVPKAGLVFQNAFPTPDASIGDTLLWHLSNIPAFSADKIIVTVKVPIGTPLGSFATAYARISPSQPDANAADNESLLSERVVGSYDPNDKQCSLTNISPELIQDREALTYTVRFQNTGTYSAEFVRIADTLDFERLDVSTFQVLATSHPCVTNLQGKGIVEFFFDQIDLPPSEQNEPESHGFVKYSIAPKAGLALGQTIKNTAFIYFDFNVPIITNTTMTTVALHVGTNDISKKNQESQLRISPNPSTGIVQIQTGENLPGSLRVFNGIGSVVLLKSDFSDNEKLDLSSLAAGLYTLEWQSAKGPKRAGRLILLK